MKNKIITLLVVMAMIFSLFPSFSLAADGQINSDGAYDISNFGNDSIITISGNHTVILTNTSGETFTNMQIECKSSNGIGVNLTLENVKIDNSEYDGACALKFFDDSTNKLVLNGESSLISGSSWPGILVESGTYLEISGLGSIEVIGGEAGIGGGGDISTSQTAGEIVIKNGIITARSNGSGAGIGGGSGGSGGVISISGGTITAHGHYYCAGIGGGDNANGGEITITGGTVTTTGGFDAAGIGGGRNGNAGTISIEGGTIFAACGGVGGPWGPQDIGYGKDIAGGTFSLTNSAIVFLKGGICLTPDTFTHSLYTTNDLEDQRAFGLDIPQSWSEPIYAYLNSSNVYTLEYDVNGGTGTLPDAITQYYNTTTTIADGVGMHNGTLAFSAWNTAADGSGTSYKYGDEFTFTTNTTLYAIYEEVYTQGDGTESSPFGVTTPEQLNAVRYFSDAHFVMLNDIDMSAATSEGGAYYYGGAGWEPIQDFSGIFDGAGYHIIGLQVYRPQGAKYESDYVGLFGFLKQNSEIKNVTLIDTDMTGTGRVGGIAGIANANTLIRNCFVSGSLSTKEEYEYEYEVTDTCVGGIAGSCGGEISCCYNAAQIKSDYYAGGITGRIVNANINNCYNTGDISADYQSAGIVCVSDRSTISNCYNIGSTNGMYGIAADTHEDTYSNCYYIYNDFHATDNSAFSEFVNVEAKTIEEMQLQSSFVGFDFENVWTINGDADYPCPELQSVVHIEPSNNTADFASGNGLPYNPYMISTPEHLNKVRNYLGAWFVLSNDIDLSTITSEGGSFYHNSQGWVPIGDEDDFFYGRFDGCGYNITGCSINRPDQDYIGLFGYIENFDMPAVENLSMYDYNITGHDYTAAVAGYSNSIIQSCYSDGIINGNKYSAGIVGRSYKCIDCENAGSVYGYRYTGGITAYNTGIISNCTNSGDVTGENDNVGGILGEGAQQVIDCSNTGSISGNYCVGGIVGSNTADVTSCGNQGAITGISWVGGVVGKNSNSGILKYCYNTNTISSTSFCGGIAGGSDHGLITCCYNSGWIWGRLNGGIVGSIEAGVINNCFNVGKVTEASKYGGIAGEVTFQTTIDSCYNAWNQYGDDIYGFIIDSDENANITNCYYLYEGDLELGDEAKTFEELCQQTTYEGFDFATVWEIIEGERFPILQNIPFEYATGLSLIEDTITLNPGEQAYIMPSVMPNNATNQSVMWLSSNESVATIDDNNIGPADGGKVRITSLTGGSATITAKTLDGSFVATCEVTVTQTVTSVLLDQTEIDIYVGDTVSLTATVNPSNATNKNVSWSSDNGSVATVENGTITAVAEGTATITVTTQDGGFTDTCTVTVNAAQIESSVYTVDQTNGLLRDVKIDTSVTQLKANLTNSAADIKVFDKDGVEYTGDTVASGMVVKLVIDDTARDELTVSILADVSGDGEIDISDILYIRADIIDTYILKVFQFSAADINKDGIVDITDLLYIRAHIIGTYNIHA